jgi:hypothetical protein
MEILRDSRLASEDIELIWDSVDIGNKDALTKEEFRMMMDLMGRRRKGLKIGPETVSDWRLEQLKTRRKPTTPQDIDYPSGQSSQQQQQQQQRQHGSMMKELQPILSRRARHLEKQQLVDEPRHHHRDRESGKSDLPSDDWRRETQILLSSVRQTNWANRSTDDIQTMIEKLERLLEIHTKVEAKLDTTLEQQRDELQQLENREIALKSTSQTVDTGEQTFSEKSFRKEIERIGGELDRLLLNVRT